MKKLLYIVTLFGGVFSLQVNAQNIDIKNIKAHVQPDIDVTTLKEKLEENTQEHYMPCHALSRDVDKNISSGDFKNGSYYWKVAGQDFGFRAFLQVEVLPEFDTLFVLNKYGEKVEYLTTTNLIQEKWTSSVVNDELMLQYKPFNSVLKPQVKIRSYSIGVAKRINAIEGFGDSQPCEVNINCPEGNNYQAEKNSVVRIDVKIGSAFFWCTGSLVNNTAFDHKPYILTAEHCALHGSNFATAQDFADWIFYFQYEGPNCTNPANEGNLANKHITGATM